MSGRETTCSREATAEDRAMRVILLALLASHVICLGVGWVLRGWYL